MNSRKQLIALILIVAVAATAPAAYAGENAFTKLSRGLVNIISSPLEYISEYMKLEEDHNTAAAVIGSVFTGTVSMVARILGGAYEVVTFPVPVPSAYKPLMQPPTPIDNFPAAEGSRRQASA